MIIPGGYEESKGHVAVFLCNESRESIQAYYKILMKHPTDQAKKTYGVEEEEDSLKTFDVAGSRTAAWGIGDFAMRETVLTYLNNGTLTLEIHLRTNKQTEPSSFVPSNPFNDNVLKGFNNEEMSDITFEVGGEVESATNRRKR